MVKKKGNLRQWQKDEKLEAEMKIKMALQDGKPHTPKELIDKTGLSKGTINTHLKDLIEKVEVIRLMDETKKYPYPVTYRLKQPIPGLDCFHKEQFAVLDIAEKNFQETLNPVSFFMSMNDYLNMNMLSLIPLVRDMKKTLREMEIRGTIKSKKPASQELSHYADVMIDIYLSSTLKLFAETFIETVLNYGSELDINELWKELVVRMKKQREAPIKG